MMLSIRPNSLASTGFIKLSRSIDFSIDGRDDQTSVSCTSQSFTYDIDRFSGMLSVKIV